MEQPPSPANPNVDLTHYQSTVDAPAPVGLGENQLHQYFQLPDGKIIPIDPNNPEAAVQQLPGPVVAEFPEGWEPACQDPKVQAMYDGDTPDLDYFKDIQYLPLGATYMMAPAAGMPFMDPYGILNPAALPPVAPLPPKGNRRLASKARNSRRRRFFCC